MGCAKRVLYRVCELQACTRPQSSVEQLANRSLRGITRRYARPFSVVNIIIRNISGVLYIEVPESIRCDEIWLVFLADLEQPNTIYPGMRQI